MHVYLITPLVDENNSSVSSDDGKRHESYSTHQASRSRVLGASDLAVDLHPSALLSAYHTSSRNASQHRKSDANVADAADVVLNIWDAGSYCGCLFLRRSFVFSFVLLLGLRRCSCDVHLCSLHPARANLTSDEYAT
jgi:hypothetical protein